MWKIAQVLSIRMHGSITSCKCGLFLIFFYTRRCSLKIFLAINSFASCDAVIWLAVRRKWIVPCTLHEFIFKNSHLLVLTFRMRFRTVRRVLFKLAFTQQAQMHVPKRKFCSFTSLLQKIRFFTSSSFRTLFSLFFIFCCNLCRNVLFNFLIWKMYSGN